MFLSRVAPSLGRMVANRNVSLQTRRTLYPHYLRYMAYKIPGEKPIPLAEQIAVYFMFLIGIPAIPFYVMYDVGKKRPR